MIHIITSENRHLYGPQLWAMHEERRRQCVEKNGWVDLVVLDGGEVDDYDDHRAMYLLGFDDDMQLEVGLRLRPTEDRCMLADKFAHLIAPGETPKKGPDVWEATRLFTTETYRKRKGPGRGERVFECWAAAFELALRHGSSGSLRHSSRLVPAESFCSAGALRPKVFEPIRSCPRSRSVLRLSFTQAGPTTLVGGSRLRCTPLATCSSASLARLAATVAGGA